MQNFVSFVASIAELGYGEKLRTHSITHSINQSPSLFDAPGNEALENATNGHINNRPSCMSEKLILETVIALTEIIRPNLIVKGRSQ